MYVIQTEESDLSAVQAVEAYKDLSEIERSFRELKDLIEVRPIYHHRPNRVRAHIFVAALASPCTSLTFESVQRSDVE